MESSAGIADRGGAALRGGGRPLPRDGRRAEPVTAAAEGALAHVLDYLVLTKPKIISLLLWTTVTTMLVARPSGLALSTVLWTCLGGYLASGGAGAINHYIDRDIDARMGRTRGRPIVSGRIKPVNALVFGISLGVIATVQLAITVNALAAGLSLLGLLGYTLMYTAWLKPRTPQNIVIGGALYLASALVLGGAFIVGSARLLRNPSKQASLQLYLGSLAYLFILFGAMAADRVIAVW